MKRFLSRFESLITGVLSGFDRLVFRGTLRPLMRPHGMDYFLHDSGVSLSDFARYADTTCGRVKEAALAAAADAGRPVRYLSSSGDDKADIAASLLASHPVQAGVVCALYAVEPCRAFEYHRSKILSERGFRLVNRKCLHVYQYWLHPTFGFMNARIQTWFPFQVQVCLNGREWLARQLTAAGVEFVRHDNCFLAVGDVTRASELLAEQLSTAWPTALTEIARGLNPLHPEIFERAPMDYYWSAFQTEWATDVMFRDPASLATMYPALVRHAVQHFKSPDVMRFLGRKAHGNYTGEIVTSFKDRAEGVRVKHWVNGNSVKMYDKGGSVLRIETTLGCVDDFKVLRPHGDAPDAPLKWQPMRQSVADLHRRAEVSQAANERYLDALSVVDDSTPLAALLDTVARPTTYRDKRVRALRTGDPDDVALLAAVARGEFTTAGFRNRDIRRLLHAGSDDAEPADLRRLSARVGRQLRLLRAHGLIQKVQKSHRYVLTARGAQLTGALSAARNATIKQLMAA